MIASDSLRSVCSDVRVSNPHNSPFLLDVKLTRGVSSIEGNIPRSRCALYRTISWPISSHTVILLLQHLCPLDVKASGWYGFNACFNACSKNCGTIGTDTKTRSVITPAAHIDLAAPALTQIKPCNRLCCTLTAMFTPGGPCWTTCTKTCGTMGTKTRCRSILTHASCGGATSGPLIDSVACNRFACPIDCKFCGNADAAAADNGAADKTKTRSVIALTAHGDLAAPALAQIKPCNRFCCPVNGNVPSWEASAGLLAPRPAAPWAPRLAMPLYSYPRLMCGGAKTQAPAPSQPP